MNYKDQLVLTGKINDVGAYTRTNIPTSYRIGIELQASYALISMAKYFRQSYIKPKQDQNYTEYIDDYDNGGQKTNFYKESDISFSPDINCRQCTVSFSNNKRWKLDLINKYVGKQYLDNSSNEKENLTLLYKDVVGYILVKGFEKLRCHLPGQVFNIFNRKYESNGYTFSYYLQ